LRIDVRRKKYGRGRLENNLGKAEAEVWPINEKSIMEKHFIGSIGKRNWSDKASFLNLRKKKEPDSPDETKGE